MCLILYTGTRNDPPTHKHPEDPSDRTTNASRPISEGKTNEMGKRGGGASSQEQKRKRKGEGGAHTERDESSRPLATISHPSHTDRHTHTHTHRHPLSRRALSRRDFVARFRLLVEVIFFATVLQGKMTRQHIHTTHACVHACAYACMRARMRTVSNIQRPVSICVFILIHLRSVYVMSSYYM